MRKHQSASTRPDCTAWRISSLASLTPPYGSGSLVGLFASQTRKNPQRVLRKLHAFAFSPHRMLDTARRYCSFAISNFIQSEHSGPTALCSCDFLTARDADPLAVLFIQLEGTAPLAPRNPHRPECFSSPERTQLDEFLRLHHSHTASPYLDTVKRYCSFVISNFMQSEHSGLRTPGS